MGVCVWTLEQAASPPPCPLFCCREWSPAQRVRKWKWQWLSDSGADQGPLSGTGLEWSAQQETINRRLLFLGVFISLICVMSWDSRLPLLPVCSEGHPFGNCLIQSYSKLPKTKSCLLFHTTDYDVIRLPTTIVPAFQSYLVTLMWWVKSCDQLLDTYFKNIYIVCKWAFCRLCLKWCLFVIKEVKNCRWAYMYICIF